MSNGELESFHFVSEKPVVTGVVVKRVSIAEPEQTHRRKPLNADADRCTQLVKLRLVFDGAAELVGESYLACIEYVTDIVEK